MKAVDSSLALCSALRSRNALLWYLGVLHLGLLGLSAVWFTIDYRIVGGINPWIKPMKFDVSITIYVWTMAWILFYLPADFARRISLRIAASMLTETVLIGVQATRGVRSHFNHETRFDEAVFLGIALGILYNFYLLVRVTVAYFQQPISVPLPCLRGIQLGLISVLAGNLLGVCMLLQEGNAVGMADGGPGLPFLNWSTRTGDLRVPHFIALHGLQALLVLGIFVSRPELKSSEMSRVQIVNLGFVLYLGLTVWLFVMALQGRPLVGL